MLLVERVLCVSVTMVAFAILVLAAGCGSAGQVELTEADDGSQIEMGKGQTLVVTLGSNPSTGYRWERVPSEAGVLQQSGEAEFEQGSRKGLVGASGHEMLRFKAMETGATKLELVYHRPWEQEAKPEGVFSVTVVVR